MTLILTIAVAWIALDLIFVILWAWACQPTLAAREAEKSQSTNGGER